MANRRKWSAVLCVVLLVALWPSLLSAGSGPFGWTKVPGNPVLDVGAPGTWDAWEVFDPAVLYDGSTYRMWYTGSSDGNLLQIGYATSPDGVSWTRSGANPVLSQGTTGTWDARGARFAAVINDGGTYKMWYTGGDASRTNRIGYATSPDGVVWTKYAGNPVLNVGPAGAWDDRHVTRPTVVKDGSIYKMWYEGWRGSDYAIGYATSPDGINWTRHPGNPVLVGAPAPSWDYHVYAPSVILDGGVYRMLYSGANFSDAVWEVGYATSPDGINWTRHGRVLQQGPDGAFDRFSADYPALLRVGDIYKMWYSGMSDAYRIGLATAPWLDLDNALYLPQALRDSGPCSPVWFDDFSDYHSGWPIFETADEKFEYTGGEYQILLKAANAYTFGSPGVQMTDGVIVASVRFGAPGDNSDNGGIMLGQQLGEYTNFYRFVVIRRGDYCLQRHDAGAGWVDLKCAAASGFVPYPGTNRLKVVRKGADIAAYLNGQWLATVSDGSFMGAGQVGLVVGTSAGNADLRFDNYGVYPVSCADQVSR